MAMACESEPPSSDSRRSAPASAGDGRFFFVFWLDDGGV